MAKPATSNRSTARSADPFVAAAAFALVSQGVAALFDFGISIPATMLAVAVLVGSTAGRAAQLLVRSGWSAPRLPRLIAFPAIRSAALAGAVCCVFLAGGAWSLRELSASSQAWRDRRSVPKLERPDAMTDDELAGAIARLEQDAQAIPDDAETHLTLADLWIYRFRRGEFEKASLTSAAERRLAWDATDPLSLTGQAHAWGRKGQLERVRMLAEAPAVRESLLPAVRHLEAARVACAWGPWTDLTLATLRFADQPRPPAALDELRRGVHILPGNDSAWFRGGLLAECSGEETVAWGCWKRTLTLDPTRLGRIRPRVAERLSLSEQLARVYPDSPEFLLKLAEQFYASPEQTEGRYAIVDRALAAVTESPRASQLETARSLAVRARGTALRDQGAQAITLYGEALQLSPYNAEWRHELAETYRKAGDVRRALEQAEIALALAPTVQRTQALVTELRTSASVPGPKPIATPPRTTSAKGVEQVGYRALESTESPVKSP